MTENSIAEDTELESTPIEKGPSDPTLASRNLESYEDKDLSDVEEPANETGTTEGSMARFKRKTETEQYYTPSLGTTVESDENILPKDSSEDMATAEYPKRSKRDLNMF